ncbi:MAG: peptidylprolyl isomerase [candidate division Zixibacteria bacterium]|nr:peptidylprolyl isomerase [candidate division Zixibacteria bacterium]
MKYSVVLLLIVITFSSFFLNCAGERRAQEGDTVKVHYTGSLNDGTVFDESRKQNEPFTVTIGSGGAIPGFENAIIGMAMGETKTITIPPEEAYGEWNREYVIGVPRNQFPPDVEIKEGQEFQQQTATGSIVKVKVISIEKDTVVVDGNHPMSGKALTFDLELMEFVD